MTKIRTAGERAVAFLSIARGVKYGAPTCAMEAGDIYLDPAPQTYDTAQRAAGADVEAAARVARHPSVIAANAVAAHCYAALDATFVAGAHRWLARHVESYQSDRTRDRGTRRSYRESSCRPR
jgi:hypothetical protein